LLEFISCTSIDASPLIKIGMRRAFVAITIVDTVHILLRASLALSASRQQRFRNT
jgi:hypothetical protein